MQIDFSHRSFRSFDRNAAEKMDAYGVTEQGVCEMKNGSSFLSLPPPLDQMKNFETQFIYLPFQRVLIIIVFRLKMPCISRVSLQKQVHKNIEFSTQRRCVLLAEYSLSSCHFI